MSKRHAVSRNSARRGFDRLPSWAKPRIGLLEHHEPRPLRVPARYLRLGAPEPAPTITIVTPSYQQGRFLDRTIYSVVSQGRSYAAFGGRLAGGCSVQTLIE